MDIEARECGLSNRTLQTFENLDGAGLRKSIFHTHLSHNPLLEESLSKEIALPF